jgi:tetratricopeptide (TPR) repeat protein
MVIATRIARMQNIAAAVPENLIAQQRAALLLTKFGLQQEAIDLLQTVLERHPTFADGQLLMGNLRVGRREFDAAVTCFEAAAKDAKEKNVRVMAHHKLGEVYLQQKKTAAAKAEFHAALQLDPHFEESQKALLALGEMVPASR